MDAIKFIKELSRMCDAQDYCDSCPAKECECSLIDNMVKDTRIVAIVEAWSAAHPCKTRQSVFLEQYPEAAIDVRGVLQICPMAISDTYRDSNGECVNPTKRCEDCRREFWMQEVE